MDRARLVSYGFEGRDYDPIHPRGTDWRGRLRKMLGPVVAAGAALAKWSFIALKAASVFIAVGAYALIGGWTFGVGFILMILAHEMGHYLEARREGLHPKLPVFIPFAGAYVKYIRGNPWQTVRIGIAGPIFGGLASVVILVVSEALDSPVLHYVAYWGFLINLINLIPIGFLDGGHVLQSAKWLRLGGGRNKAMIAYALYGGTAVALALGMWASYIPQHRL